MEIRTVYKKLASFASLASGLDDQQIIFANQRGIKPIKPFITIDVRTIKQIGTTLEKQVDDEGVESSILSMRATATFQCFGAKLFEAEGLLLELDAKFNTELTNEIFEQELVKLKTLKPVTTLPTFVDSQLEHRAIFEIEIAFNRVTTYRAGLIEKFELSSTINKEKIILQRGMNGTN